MGLRVNANPLATASHYNLERNDDALTSSIQRLGTGLRVNRSGDDTAATNISERMRAQVRGLDNAASNVQDAGNYLGTAEAALNETAAILQRMRELLVQGASDTQSASDRTSIQGELDNLSAEIDRIGNKTEFNSHKLLDGTRGLFTIQVGAEEGDIHTFSIRDMRSAALNVAANADVTVNTAALACLSIRHIDIAIEAVNRERDYLGAKMNSLAQNMATVTVQSQNIGAAENRYRDVDFAKEASRLSRSQLLGQSSTAMLAQANATPQAVLGLLR